MNILIASANRSMVECLHGKTIIFEPHTANTVTFKMTPKTFEKLRKKANDAGINEFALFVW